jgi:hypothetical protein
LSGNAAGLIIALTHAPLGLEVLKRGIIFIDLAIAQIAGLGLVAASLYAHEPAWWVVQRWDRIFMKMGQKKTQYEQFAPFPKMKIDKYFN